MCEQVMRTIQLGLKGEARFGIAAKLSPVAAFWGLALLDTRAHEALHKLALKQ